MYTVSRNYALDVVLLDERYGWPDTLTDILLSHCFKHINVRTLASVSDIDRVKELLREGCINTIIIGPRMDKGPSITAAEIADFIESTRQGYPYVVFAICTTRQSFENLCKINKRFIHYIYINIEWGQRDWRFDPEEFDLALKRCGEWHNNLFQYDVAISFAGEDRDYARELADALRGFGARVFFDDYERGSLLGKDLYTHLHNVYYKTARYCVLLISKAYEAKLWTSHECRAAQERAFKQAMMEYILPIRLDDTPIPGLRDTIGYARIDEGIPRLAEPIASKIWKLDPQREPDMIR